MYVDQYLRGKLNLDLVITNKYQLEEINQAFNNMEHGKAGRTLIEMIERPI